MHARPSPRRHDHDAQRRAIRSVEVDVARVCGIRRVCERDGERGLPWDLPVGVRDAQCIDQVEVEVDGDLLETLLTAVVARPPGTAGISLVTSAPSATNTELPTESWPVT